MSNKRKNTGDRSKSNSGAKRSGASGKKKATSTAGKGNKSISFAKIKRAPKKVQKSTKIHIVGIGASAGGLEALRTFFSNMPSDSNMAFIVVQHLAPNKKSLMGELIQHDTDMEIHFIEDNETIRPNCIYLSPPDRDIAIYGSKLQLLMPDKSKKIRMPIDFMFRSLAENRKENAVCIILSGTGTDGTLGLKAIKGEGGLTIVQDFKTAKYDGMPRNAFLTGLVDIVLPVEKIPRYLLNYVDHSYFRSKKRESEFTPRVVNSLEKIFVLLRNKIGHDFSFYKKNTLQRRIERRMAVHQLKEISEYVDLMRENSLEIDCLFKELLIGVTNFFRDPGSFTSLKNKCLIELLKDRDLANPLRIWVPGCSTGEEAFSIALLVKEIMETLKQRNSVQIFATDLDNNAIENARSGHFPKGIAADISPERLERFFTRENIFFRINKEIREMIVFAEQDIIQDPPFSKLDLISCRNLLIYMNTEIQKKLLSLFHYTLNEGGFLFLGSSESIGQFSDLFSEVDKKWKIFKKKSDVHNVRTRVEFPLVKSRTDMAHRQLDTLEKNTKEDNIQEMIEKTLLREFSPTCVCINDRYEILYLFGKTGKYLEPAEGKPRMNLLEMAREGLKLHLASTFRKVMKSNVEHVCENIEIKDNSKTSTVNLRIRPVTEPESFKGTYLLIFEEVQPLSKQKGRKDDHVLESDTENRIMELEQELQSSKEYLKTTVEELETSNEELKSTNEELQSSNEELQSTNEELETSKEELQSVNEELHTVNSELESKMNELTQANNDMNNLLASTEIATIFLNVDMKIIRFTPQVNKVINIIQSDLGRPLSHLVTKLKYDHLISDIQKVLDTLIPGEMEVLDINDAVYLMRIMPYRTIENVIEGVVITFVEISDRKTAEAELLKSESRLKIAQHTASIGDWSIDLLSGETVWSEEIYNLLGLNIGSYKPNPGSFREFSHPDDKDNVSEEKIRAVLRTEGAELEFRFACQRTGEYKDVLLIGMTSLNQDGTPIRISGTLQDISAMRDVETALQSKSENLDLILDTIPALIYYKNKENMFIRVNKAFSELTGYSRDAVEGKSAFELFPKQAEQYWADERDVIENGQPKRNIIEPFETRTGTKWVITDKIPLKNRAGETTGVLGFTIDLSAKQEMIEILKNNAGKLVQPTKAQKRGKKRS